jgi:hypothetical protein
MIAVADPRIPLQWHVFRTCQWDTREKLKARYRVMKKTGKISGGLITGGLGLWGLAKEIGKDTVVFHGKRGLGCAITGTIGWLCPVPIKLMTNSTKIVRGAMAVSNTCAAAFRITENVADAPLVVCDFFLFGEYLPTNDATSYNLFNSKVTDRVNDIIENGGK